MDIKLCLKLSYPRCRIQFDLCPLHARCTEIDAEFLLLTCNFAKAVFGRSEQALLVLQLALQRIDIRRGSVAGGLQGFMRFTCLLQRLRIGSISCFQRLFCEVEG